MTSNVYDDEAFFAGYSQLGRSRHGLDGAAEWPALRALLPPLAGRTVADLGCGYGWFCRWARAAGAARVEGFDLSEKMLARARGFGTDPAITYTRADLETLALPARQFDLVYSSLAFHYVVGLGELLARTHRALVPGGRLVFSFEHPIYLAPTHQHFTRDAEGRRIWPLDRYLEEGPREADWLGGRVVKQHRTLGTTLGLLLAAGFTFEQLVEWSPTDELLAANPVLAEERDRPMFALVAARA